MSIRENIAALRRAMNAAGLDAYIITGSDPHGSEIPPLHWRTRKWISGFSGSAGTVIVTKDSAALWTDFRYWIQAAVELKDSGIELCKERHPDWPELEDWLANQLSVGSTVGIDGRTVDLKTSHRWALRLEKAGAALVSDVDLISALWSPRPELPGSPVWELDDLAAGESRASRLLRLREALQKVGAESYVALALDSAAWLFNVRAADVPYVPVAVGFAYVDRKRALWFTDSSRVPQPVVENLQRDGVELIAYDGFFSFLRNLSDVSSILVDKETASQALLDALPASMEIREGRDPVFTMKARKNSSEIRSLSKAMAKDGAALVRFFVALEAALAQGETISETDAAERLRAARASMPGFLQESFSPIPGYGGNGAICHYEAKEDSAAVLQPGKGIFLIDSGGQWEEGTTDITRTIALGTPTDQQKKDYTWVLKGHVALSQCRFPKGTRGYQIDALARIPLWNQAMDFGHGTGHGVGFLLNVHEGPHRISPAPIDVVLEPGMLVSNEPGLYREGDYGIRIENLIVCRPDQTNEFGEFYAFDTLTLAPYDPALIDLKLLSDEDIAWINAYHRRVFDELSPYLENHERRWLEDRVRPL